MKEKSLEHDVHGRTLGLQLLLGEAEGLHVVLVDGIPQTGVGALVEGAGASLGDAGDVVLGGLAALDGSQGGPGSLYEGTYAGLWDAIDEYNCKTFGFTKEQLEAQRPPMAIMF